MSFLFNYINQLAANKGSTNRDSTQKSAPVTSNTVANEENVIKSAPTTKYTSTSTSSTAPGPTPVPAPESTPSPTSTSTARATPANAPDPTPEPTPTDTHTPTPAPTSSQGFRAETSVLKYKETGKSKKKPSISFNENVSEEAYKEFDSKSKDPYDETEGAELLEQEMKPSNSTKYKEKKFSILKDRNRRVSSLDAKGQLKALDYVIDELGEKKINVDKLGVRNVSSTKNLSSIATQNFKYGKDLDGVKKSIETMKSPTIVVDTPNEDKYLKESEKRVMDEVNMEAFEYVKGAKPEDNLRVGAEGYIPTEFSFEEQSVVVAWEKTSPENGGVLAEHAYLINRRAPRNPFKSNRIKKNKTIPHNKLKADDPALMSTGVIGKLVVAISTSALLVWMFFFEHVLNYTTFGGKCASQVIYPDITEAIKPFVIDVGYGACEYNTGIMANERCPVGSCSSYEGYPKTLVRNGQIAELSASWDSFNARTLFAMGGLDTNLIRNYGELFRVFWAMYLHAGWLHIFMNVISQIQILWMIEPDWGFIRSALTFFVSGITGNLLSAVCDPCSVTVGSSGAMYGLLGALIPYCIEYWKSIPRPGCVIALMIIVIFVGILLGMTGITDNYAHMGGCLGGILLGFATITNVSAFDKCTFWENIALSGAFKWALTPDQRRKIIRYRESKKKQGLDKRLVELVKRKTATGKKGKFIYAFKKFFEKEGRPKCKMSKREWIVRGTCIVSLILIWVLLFIYLLVPSLYKNSPPPGNLKFSGWIPCYCCEIYTSGQTGTDLLKFDLGWGAGRLYGNEGLFWCWSSKSAASRYCNKTIP